MIVAIITIPLFAEYANLTIWKTPPNIMAGTVFNLINGMILVTVYSVIYTGLPGTNWRKGLNYGIIVSLFRVLMGTFSTIVMYNIPLTLTITSLITGCVEIITVHCSFNPVWKIVST